MSTVFTLPSSAHRQHAVAPHDEPGAHSHAVQFYEDEAYLFQSVGSFVAAGLERGEHVVAIAQAQHREGFLRQLSGLDVDGLVASGHLTLLDAREILARFMVEGMPDGDLLGGVVGELSANLRRGGTASPARVYSEMVDVLWWDGHSTAALALEELWGNAVRDHSLVLLCAYGTRNFHKASDAESFMNVCRAHTHVLASETFVSLGGSDARMREVSLLQQRARSLEHEVQQRRELEAALRDALDERAKAEDELRACLRREQAARVVAEANDSFKEMFLGILGHELRNPLNTVLTTARLMTMRGELTPESQRRLGRVISSGERMQRMIEQLLDLTRARLADGILVERGKPRDLCPLVASIVDEVRAANPGRLIEVVVPTACSARIDEDRFEQVIANLLTNALVHGDAAKPVRVEVGAPEGTCARVSIHNHGAPIPPALIPYLFDPFIRARDTTQQSTRGPGLGLGLYISERIVSAHGGKIEVESTEASGTTFTVWFLRS